MTLTEILVFMFLGAILYFWFCFSAWYFLSTEECVFCGRKSKGSQVSEKVGGGK